MQQKERVEIGTLTIHEEFTHTQRYETACNFDTYLVHPGTYPIVRTIGYGSDSILAEVAVTHTQRYMVSRLFMASSVDSKTEGETTFRFGHYYIRYITEAERALDYLRTLGTVTLKEEQE